MRVKRWLGRISGSILLGLCLVWASVTAFAAPPDYNWYIRMIRADEAWAAGWTGKGVAVGVLDTGVDTTHPGFGNRLTAQEFMDREGFYYNPANRNIPYDPWNIYQAGGSYYLTASGHGTAVAGLIGGYLTTPLTDGTTWTYKGIAYESLLKVGSIRDNPKSSDPGYPYSGFGINSEVLGETGGPIDWLLARGVRVINNSWGSTTQITNFNLTDKNPVTLGYLEQKTLDGWRKAVSSNVLIVFSAGNDGGSPRNFTQPSLEGGLPYLYPELRKSWINAVAVSSNSLKSSYSQPAGAAAAWTLSAPGGEWATNGSVPHDLTGVIAFRSRNMNALNGQPFSLTDYNLEGDDFQLPDGTVADENSRLKQFLGTSAAAPIISAGSALVLQAHPDYTAQMVAQTLFTTANHSGAYADTATYGWGMMDLAEAVQGPRYLRKALLLGLNPTYTKGQLVAEVLAGTSPSFDNDMTGDGGLVKTGAGSLTLKGDNDYTGDTDILAGTLYVDGSLTGSAINLSSGAFLGGHGTLTLTDGLTIGSGATLAPGHSPTTMTVNATVTQSGGSNLQVDLAGHRYNSMLAVTGVGNPYILSSTGGGVTLVPQLWNSYAPALGDAWTLVTAEGGVVGTFSALSLPAAYPTGMSLDVLYGENAIVSYATPADYRQVTALGWNWNSNQSQVAALWQADRPAKLAALTAEENLVYGTLYTLTGAGLRAAAGQMSGQLIADSQSGSLELLRGTNRNLAAMLHEEPAADHVQVRQFRQWGRTGTYAVAGRDVQGNGTIVNVEFLNKSQFRAGVGFATMKGSTVSLSGPGVSTLEQTGGHVYAQYRPGKFFVDAQLGVGRTNDRHDRQLTAWGMSASGSAGGQHWFGRLAVGQDRVRGQGRQEWSLALLGERMARDGFQETGDDLLRVSAAATRDSRLAAELSFGRSLTGGVKTGRGFRRNYSYRVGVLHELRNTDTTANLIWGGSPLRIVSQKAGADAVQAELTGTWETAGGWKLSAGVQGEWRRFGSNFGVNAALSYSW